MQEHTFIFHKTSHGRHTYTLIELSEIELVQLKHGTLAILYGVPKMNAYYYVGKTPIDQARQFLFQPCWDPEAHGFQRVRIDNDKKRINSDWSREYLDEMDKLSETF